MTRPVYTGTLPLHLTTTGSGTGTIKRSLVADRYPYGSTVTLTAREAKGSVFKGWHGDASGLSNFCRVTMDSEKTITAEFVQMEFYPEKATAADPSCQSFPLNITKTGTGKGTVTHHPYAESYPQGSVVSLTASAEAGSKFVRWQGDLTGGFATCNVRMDSAKTIMAEFVRIDIDHKKSATADPSRQSFPLNITTAGSGKGTVTRHPDAESYPRGSVVTLTASAEVGSKFDRWTGDVTGGFATCNVRMDSDKSVSADFVSVLFSATQSAASPVSELAGGLQQIETTRRTTQAIGAPSADSAINTNGVVAKSNSLGGFIGHFINHGDGTVTDTRTGLTWMLAAEGQEWKVGRCFGGPRKVSLHEALTLQPDFAGHTDWRLPTISELKSVIPFDTRVFLKPIEGYIWSSTEYHSSGSRQDGWYWIITPKGTIGFGHPTTGNEFVHLVRSPETFALVVTRRGTGTGTVTGKLESGHVNQSPEGERYGDGSAVTLTAHAAEGSKFKRWHGDASGSSQVCTVKFDSKKTVSAEFIQLESFSLGVKTNGTGRGTVTRSKDADKYFIGSAITLTAHATEGSVFSGWQGDAISADGVCTITMDSTKVITARFDKLDIPDLGIGVAYDNTEDATMGSGDQAFILHLTFTNHAEKQAQIEIPLSIYASGSGEEIEQSVWLSGLVAGNKACTIRAGAFRKMGLVFLKSKLAGVSTGDHLHVTVIQKKPSRRLHFSFRCTHQEARSFTLVNATAEDTQAPEETIEMAEILRRLVLMEEGLSDMRRKLDGLQVAPSPAAVKAINRKPPENTLKEVVAWLATQGRIAVATFRIHLLPLDLLPTAVIDKLNERALDLTGELALEELGDEIVVTREILDEVLANWDPGER